MGVAEYNNPGFISQIIEDVNLGYCFTPLIGSGLSSPSGIIMGMEFTNYLAFATYLVLSDPTKRPRTHGEGVPAPWDLRHEGWPPLPSNHEVQLAKRWVLDEFKQLCSRFDLELNYEEGTELVKSISRRSETSYAQGSLLSLVYPHVPTIIASDSLVSDERRSRRVAEVLVKSAGARESTIAAAVDFVLSDPTRSYHQRIIEMGIRSLHDWRETLVTLSSIAVDKQESGFGLVKDRRTDSVIDRFNSFITRDKRPNLGHKMLAHLSGPMRFHSVLTTNFDTLTEDAFRALDLKMRVLPVSSLGSLPEPQTVGADCTLVKLHGELQNTRADTSLDDEPSEEDKKTLVDYLTRGSGNLCRRQPRGASKRLLVIGYSGSDQRCVQMIRHWLENGPDRPVLYWVCFSEFDRAKAKQLFAASDYDHRVRVTQCPRPDLLLHELYQRLVLSLPPGGLTYEFTHVVPPQRRTRFDYDETIVRNALEGTKTKGGPLEAARVLLSESAKPDDARRLARDAMTLGLKELILQAIDNSIVFYDANGTYRPVASTFYTASLWRPWYRESACDENRTQEKDRGLFEGFQSKPVVIDSAGGVVRAVAQAVDELTARSARKVLWIETQDYMDADALLRDFLRALAVRCGSFQSRQVTQHPLALPLANIESPAALGKEAALVADHLKLALMDYRVDANEIVVLLYGRDSYGPCSGLIPSPWSEQTPEAERRVFARLHCLIEALGRAGVPTVYFPLVPARAKSKKGHQTLLDGRGKVPKPWASLQAKIDQPGHWPSDVYCATRDEGDDSRSSAGSINYAGTSVFQAIVEAVLAPYFAFSGGVPSPRKDALGPLDERKLVFLYALTLFRHSRHANALSSEAVCHCPYRFNASAIDNDFLRAAEIAQWIEDLRKARVFFDKAGGSVWMHRDIRLTLQRLLERVNLRTAARDKDRARNASVREMRARLHFWIGDWYLKAFCSSGHLLPIIESVHHRVMAATYSRFAAYKTPKSAPANGDDLACYRSLLFESSILEAHKTLHIAWRALKLWQASSIEVSWLGAQHRARVVRHLSDASAVIARNEPTSHPREHRAAIVRDLTDGLEALNRELVIEGGGGGARSTSPGPSPTNISLYAHGWEHGASQPVPSTPRKPRSPLTLDHGWAIVNQSESDFQRYLKTAFEAMDAPRLLECIDRIAGDAGPSAGGYGGAAHVEELSKEKARWKTRWASQPEKLHDIIWLLGEYAYVNLRRAKLLYHAQGLIRFDYWIRTTAACNLGVDFCKHLSPWMLRFDIQSKVKLHSIYGVSLSNIGRFFEATRHFNEAQAALSKMPDSSPADVAIINLRRAEALITETFWIGLVLREVETGKDPIVPGKLTNKKWSLFEGERFGEVLGVDSLVMIDGDGSDDRGWCFQAVSEALRDGVTRGQKVVFAPWRITECVRKSSRSALPETLRRLYGSVLDEAVGLLDQAEWNLSGHSQSSLWWSRMHTLRLRVFGLLQTLGERASESLVLRKYSADQGIFQSFHHALRISQHDPFRRFRTLKYFFEANDWHLRFEDTQPGIKSRMPESYERAKKALKELCQTPELKLGERPDPQSFDPRNEALQHAIAKLGKTVNANEANR